MTDEFGYNEDDRADDWAKEDCGCGHRRSAHGRDDGCNRTVPRRDMDSLPKPEYADDDEDHPFAWPVNWPPFAELPLVTKPCPCAEFHYPEPSEPDWSDQ